MHIALDTVGGKFAPEALVEGAVLASRRWEDLTLTLVGAPAILQNLLKKFAADEQRFLLLEGSQRIDDAESPVQALESKPNASIIAALRAHHQGQVQAVVSAGSTGAQIVASIQELGLLDGVKRPAIGSYFPTKKGRSFLIDVGANVSCRPIHLVQFAAMGAMLRQLLDGLERPRVALLANGEESTKGDHVTREAHELMSLVPALNFIGNVEGNDLFAGKAEVIVCDGFTGNILLKFAESIPDILKNCADSVKQGMSQMPHTLDNLIRSFDYQEFGGVPLLGVDGVSIICHGHSTPKAISNAIGEAIKMVNLRVNQHIREQLSNIGQWSAGIKTRALFERFRRRSPGEKS